MKKGIDIKIINGSMGIPKREFIGETKWRKAKPHSNHADAMDYFFMNVFNHTEDIDYEDVTDLPELTTEFSKQLSEYNKLHTHDSLFNQPQHIAFLGHDLNHK